MLRLHALGRLSLWLDEGITAYKMSLPVHQLFMYEKLDNVPPLYYLLMHVLRPWVHSDFSLRLTSAVAGIATIPVLFLICRTTFNDSVAVLSSFFLAVSTFHVWFSQEARSYSLYCLLYALSLLFVIRWSRNPGSRADWWAYILCTVPMLYTHSTAILFWGTNQLIFAFFSRGLSKEALRKWVLAQILVGILFLPWLQTYLHQVGNYNREVVLEQLDCTILIRTSMILTSLAPLYPGNTNSTMGLSADLGAWINLSWFVAFFGPICVAVLRLNRSVLPGFLAAFSLALFPMLVVTFFSVWIRNIYFDRLFLPSVLGVTILLALGVQGVVDLFAKAKPSSVMSLGFLFLISALSFVSLRIYYELERKEDFRSASGFLVKHYQPGDVVLFVTHAGEALFDWYQDSHKYIRRTGIPDGYRETPNQSPGHVIRGENDIKRLPKIAATAKRIWLVRLRTQYHDPKELVLNWMEKNLTKVSASEFAGVKVHLYATRVRKLPLVKL